MTISEQAAQILGAAAARVERGWASGAAFAKDASGFTCPPAAPDAVAWTADGAIDLEARGFDDDDAVYKLARRAATLVASERKGTTAEPFWSHEDYNDAPDVDQQAVFSLLEQAAALLLDFPGLERVPVTPGDRISLGWQRQVLRQAKEATNDS